MDHTYSSMTAASGDVRRIDIDRNSYSPSRSYNSTLFIDSTVELPRNLQVHVNQPQDIQNQAHDVCSYLWSYTFLFRSYAAGTSVLTAYSAFWLLWKLTLEVMGWLLPEAGNGYLCSYTVCTPATPYRTMQVAGGRQRVSRTGRSQGWGGRRIGPKKVGFSGCGVCWIVTLFWDPVSIARPSSPSQTQLDLHQLMQVHVDTSGQ